jgi:DNA-directed RNA polymerase specialized sigma24 family protein
VGTPEQALEQWGAWARRGSGSVGWPQDTALGQRAAGRVTVGHGWQSGGYDDDAQALEVDRLVGSLPRELRRMLVLHYVEEGETEDKAAELQVSIAVYERALSQARAAFGSAMPRATRLQTLNRVRP